MTDLEDTFGSDFVNTYNQKRQQVRAERERIEDEEMIKISALAINEGKMSGDSPMFSYTSESGVTHDVLLVQIPDPENRAYWTLKTEGNEGSISLPLDYLGQWIWAWFNDVEMAKKLVPGEWFIVAGRLDTWERDDGTSQENISVRGVVQLSQANEWADRALEEDGFDVPDQPDTSDEGMEGAAVMQGSENQMEQVEEPTSPDELTSDESTQETAQSSEEQEVFAAEDDTDELMEEDEESGGAGAFSQMLEEKRGEEEQEQEEEKELVPFEDVRYEIEDIAEQEPRVWEVDEDQPALLDKLVNMVGNRLEYEVNEEGAVQNDDIAVAIREHALTTIEQHNEEDEQSEEENLF